jgi:hypothetical protein
MAADRLDDALLVAAVHRTPPVVRPVRQPAVDNRSSSCEYVVRNFAANDDLLAYLIVSEAVGNYMKGGLLLRAITAFLTIGDVVSAFRVARLNGEFATALLLAKTFQIDDLPVFETFLRLSEFSPASWEFVPQSLAARLRICNVVEPTGNEVEGATAGERVHALLVNGRMAEGVQLGMEFVKGEIAKPVWDFCELRGICRELEMLPHDKVVEVEEIHALSLYLATFEAMWKGYDEIWPMLMEACRTQIAWNKYGYLKPLIDRQGQWASAIGPLAVRFRPIADPNLVTMDDTTRVTRRAALMWADVMSFSPATHARLVVL